MPSGLFYFNSLDRSVSYIRDVWLGFIVTIFVEISELITNSVDPNQTLRSGLDIWVYTFCQCPFYGMPGVNGLTEKTLIWQHSFNNVKDIIIKLRTRMTVCNPGKKKESIKRKSGLYYISL